MKTADKRGQSVRIYLWPPPPCRHQSGAMRGRSFQRSALRIRSGVGLWKPGGCEKPLPAGGRAVNHVIITPAVCAAEPSEPNRDLKFKELDLRTPTGSFQRREGGKLIKFALARTANLWLTLCMVIPYVHSSLPWKSRPLLRLSKTHKISNDKSFPEELI